MKKSETQGSCIIKMLMPNTPSKVQATKVVPLITYPNYFTIA